MTTAQQTNVEQYQAPMPTVPPETRERNADKHSKGPNDWRCRICSNPVTDDWKLGIYENGDGTKIWRTDTPEDLTDEDNFGVQPVGPECARKHVPAGFLIKN